MLWYNVPSCYSVGRLTLVLLEHIYWDHSQWLKAFYHLNINGYQPVTMSLRIEEVRMILNGDHSNIVSLNTFKGRIHLFQYQNSFVLQPVNSQHGFLS